MITVYYMCDCSNMDATNKFKESVANILPSEEKEIKIITTNPKMEDAIYDPELTMVPLNKLEVLKKYVDASDSEYTIFINPNAH